MKAIVINSEKRLVGHHEFGSAVRSFYSVFNEPRQIGRLPNGDLIWADTDRVHRMTFSLGGCPQIVGTALVVGKKDEAGDYTSPRSDLDSIRRLVRFSELLPFETETTPEAVTPAIEQFVSELQSEPPAFVKVKTSFGGRSGRCWENVAAAMRVYGGHRVLGWTIWERPRLFLTAEFHAVWCTPEGELLDVTSKVDHEKQILFSADQLRYPASFDFRQRPGNRRYRIYRAEVDASAAVEGLSPAKRAYEMRQAAKRRLSLEEHIAAKMPLDPLEAAIERLFAVCAEIDSLVEVTWNGLTSDHTDQVARLDAEKMALHDEILRLAREKVSNDGQVLQATKP